MSAHPNHARPSGNNSEYSNEPVELPGSDVPAELAGADVAGLPQSMNQATGTQYTFPPPPPGPPPPFSSTSPPIGRPEEQGQGQGYQEKHQEHVYYPPPPPGPPPKQTQSYMGAGYGEAPATSDSDHDLPPPSYEEEFGHGPPLSDGDVKAPLPPPPPPGPPALPPRPVSSSMHFPPPPTSPSKAGGLWGKPPGDGSSSSSGGGSGNGGFGEKLYRWGIKAGVPVNKIANRFGSEAFWPMTMDLECDKAARILKSFCKDGFYTADHGPNLAAQPPASSTRPRSPKASGPSSPRTAQPAKVLVKIPASVIRGARGLAIFTTFRTGLHISGAGGSGVVVARLPDGSWSPPAGFLVHTLGAGFMIGIDVYDCVCVLTTQAAVDVFARRARISLGGEVAVVAGPVGVGGAVESVVGGGGSREKGKEKGSTGNGPDVQGQGQGAGTGTENKPVWSYMKSRGFYAGVQADGTVIIPRADANAAFYGERGISVERILKGQVQVRPAPTAHSMGPGGGDKENGGSKSKDGELVMWPEGGRHLSEVLKAAEGRSADADILRGLGNEPTPGDMAPPDSGRS